MAEAARTATRQYRVLEHSTLTHTHSDVPITTDIEGLIDHGTFEVVNADAAITAYVDSLSADRQDRAIGKVFVAVAMSAWNEAIYESETVTKVSLRRTTPPKAKRTRKPAAQSAS